MGHNHNHHHGNKNILLAFFLNFIFAIIELIGGYYTNSIAITSDALHDFGDSLALLFAYFAEKRSLKDADEKYTFGYRRFSILAALVNGIILFFGSIYIIFEAFGRLASPEPVNPEGMIWLAILGVLVNSFAAYRLSKNEGLNSKMVMFHLLEDLLGWLAVLIISIILIFKPWFILDSILSILIALIILKGVYKNLKNVLTILLQKFPDELDISEIKSAVSNLSMIRDVHAVKGWSIDDESFYLRLHIVVPPETQIQETDKLKSEIKEILNGFKVVYSTLEFEAQGYDC